MTGRPFGGTVILVHKELAGYCYRVPTDDPRVTCVCVKRQGSRDVVFCSVYMPWNDRSLEPLADYEATLGYLHGIIDRHIGCLFLLGGDYNVTKFSDNVCCQLLHQFSQRNKLSWLGIIDGGIHYTYHNNVKWSL